MDIIDRLKNDKLYIDAIDDAIAEIEKLRKWNEIYKETNRWYRLFMGHVASMLGIVDQQNKIHQASQIIDALRNLLNTTHKKGATKI